jgi:hypothetical protein
MKVRSIVICGLLLATIARAEIVSKPVEYKEGQTTLEGWWVYDDSVKGKRPVCWWCTNGRALAITRRSARRCWQSSVTMFSPSTSTAKAFGTITRRARRPSGEIQGQPKIAARACQRRPGRFEEAGIDGCEAHCAIGYCFGGTTALELARSGADVAGVVSFHGGLSTPEASDAKQIKAKVLALHGADDPYVPPAEVAAFEKKCAMRRSIGASLPTAGGAFIH